MKNKIRVKEKTFTLPSGHQVLAQFGNSYVATLKRRVINEYKVDDIDIREMHWDEFFEGGRLTPMMYSYRPDDCYIPPFIQNSFKDSNNKIGIRLTVKDDSVEDSIAEKTAYQRIIYRPSLGDLMLMLDIIVGKTMLIDRRGHEYSISFERGVQTIYEHFSTRIAMEASEVLKQQLYHIGGLLSGAVSVVATSPRKVFDLIEHITRHITLGST